MKTKIILLYIIEHKGSCDNIYIDSTLSCTDCIYNNHNDTNDSDWCEFEDDPDTLVFNRAKNDYIKMYGETEELFEALL